MRERRAPAVKTRALARALAPIEHALETENIVGFSAPVDVKLSPIALRILGELVKRSQRMPSDVIDELLRMHGPAMIAAAA